VRAVVAQRGRLRLEEVAEPTPGEGEVLVASLATGICGSDLRVLDRQAAAGEGPALVLGHEFCVEVLAYGPSTEPTVPVGAAACRVPFVGGSDGPEVVGLHPDRPGALAERFVLPAMGLVAVPAGVDPVHAALTEPLAVGIHAVARAQARGGSGPYLVVGCGPVGLAVIVALRQVGAGPVIASGHGAARRAAAARVGADVVVDPNERSPFAAWADLGATAVPPPPLRGDGPEPRRPVIFDCAGSDGLLARLLDAAVPGTHLVVVGAATGVEPIHPALAVRKDLSVDFVLGYTPADFSRSLERIATGAVDVAPLISSVVDVGDVTEIEARLRSRDDVKFIVAT